MEARGLVNVRAAHGTNTTQASSAWCACSRVSCPSIDTTRPSLVSAPRLWLVIVESNIDQLLVYVTGTFIVGSVIYVVVYA